MRSAGLVGISRRKGFQTTVRGSRCTASTRSGAAVFHGGAARPAVGGGHHLRSHPGRFFVPGGGDGRVQPPHRGLTCARRAHPRCAQHGDLPAAAAGCDPSFRPGHAVHIHLLSERAARRLAYDPPWVRSATVSITPCAKASSPRWNASCWTAAASRLSPRQRWAIFDFIEGWRSTTIAPVTMALPAAVMRCSGARLSRP